jgi:chromosome partitioning protein
MKILAITSQKGGVGKTTIATSLAVAAQTAGRNVALFDMDPQTSACTWSDLRKAKAEGVVALSVRDVNFHRLPNYLQAAKEAGADLVILDCPPVHRDIAHEAMSVADMVLVPTRPEVLDMMAMQATVKTVQQSGKAAHVVLTSCPPRGTEAEAAKGIIRKMGAQLVPVDLHYRKAYSRAQIMGMTAQEFEPSGKAAEEVRGLYEYTNITLYGEQHGKAEGKFRRRV